MSVVKRIISDSIERVKVDELLADEYEQAGYGGITLTKTPLGTQINLYAMRPGRVIGKRGRAIKQASERLEQELDLPNPQITVVEVEFPELNPRIMAARIANALERGVHYRRAIFWSLNRIMEAGAIGCEIVLNGPLRSNRGRYEKVSEGYVPKSGDPALKYVKTATVHVKMKKGVIGVNVTIVPPEARFPDKVKMEGLPEIEYPEEEYELPEGVEPEAPEIPETSEEQKAEAETTDTLTEETETVVEPEEKDADVETPIEETLPSQEEVQPQTKDEAKLKPDEEKSEPGTNKAPEVKEEAEEEKEG